MVLCSFDTTKKLNRKENKSKKYVAKKRKLNFEVYSDVSEDDEEEDEDEYLCFDH